MNRRTFLKTLGWGTAALGIVGPAWGAGAGRLNVLFFTADDLNCDTVGCFGG